MDKYIYNLIFERNKLFINNNNKISTKSNDTTVDIWDYILNIDFVFLYNSTKLIPFGSLKIYIFQNGLTPL